jgi:hypothetical protein
MRLADEGHALCATRLLRRSDQLRPEHLVSVYAAKRKLGMAPRTVKHLHTTIRPGGL